MILALCIFSVFLQVSLCRSKDLIQDKSFIKSTHLQEWKDISMKQDGDKKVDEKISWKYNSSLHIIPDYISLNESKASPDIRKFMVLITIRTKDSLYTCTGSILDGRRVLTAAHCFYDKEDHVDISDVYLVPSTLRGKGRSGVNLVQQVFVHRDFNAITLENDIAIVTTLSPFTTDEAKFVNLNSNLPVRAIDNIYIASYGVLEITGERILTKISYTLKKYNQCKSRFTSEVKRTIDASKVLCAAERNLTVDGEPTCFGDSGSSLFYQLKDDEGMIKMAQIGIGSFTEPSCNLPGSSSWFTKISDYVDIIEQNQMEDCSMWKTIYRIAALCADNELESSGQ